MLKLEYSQTVRKKLKLLKAELTQSYDEDKATAIIVKIVKSIRRLQIFPQSGAAVSSQYGVECNYRYIFAEHNYFFYRVRDKDTVLILEMFNEKEDFMRNLFGIITTSQETMDYWGE
ncbi:MAG: type II toxin-antitoxin system RelE/ParE family toxin [Butyrivibrio sp.]|nr:type II toxin-antitoxin system RelE/ParE family toxin [Butyrivibrio sp.]